MRRASFISLIVGVLLIPSALGVAKQDRDREASRVRRVLALEAGKHADAVQSYFARARAITLLTANSPSFARVLDEPGTREQKVRRQSRNLADATAQLRYLEKLYPTSIGEACFITADGEELARVTRGQVAPAGTLSKFEKQTVFFAPTFALPDGQVYQARPYISPDTDQWVISNSMRIPRAAGGDRAIAHFEVTVESFRQAMGGTHGYQLRVIDAASGHVIIDGARPQPKAAPLGVPEDQDFAEIGNAHGRQGITEIDNRPTAYRAIGREPGNANGWIVVATAAAPVGGLLAGLGVMPIVMLALAIVIVSLSGFSLRTSRRRLEAEATTDGLTGLENRRKLLADLDRRLKSAEPAVVMLFDLNGFKNYNDSFGHMAGDVLLARLGQSLADAVRPFGGRAYRPGGDEFCVIADPTHRRAVEAAACSALSDCGEGFEVSTAFGSVLIPQETGDVSEALRKADQAMYAQKNSGRATAARQSSNVLTRALAERHPDLGEHVDGVAELVEAVAARLDAPGEDLAQLRHAAALHDVGKVAIPDAIINKAGPLTDDEWGFMRRHTLIGERILAGAPALSGTARLVRSSHEAWNGSGYPDGLAGIEIPLGSRIIAVCDAFDAMISNRPYAKPKTVDQALEELRRCAGTQFDPTIVGVFAQVMADRGRAPTAV